MRWRPCLKEIRVFSEKSVLGGRLALLGIALSKNRPRPFLRIIRKSPGPCIIPYIYSISDDARLARPLQDFGDVAEGDARHGIGATVIDRHA